MTTPLKGVLNTPCYPRMWPQRENTWKYPKKCPKIPEKKAIKRVKTQNFEKRKIFFSSYSPQDYIFRKVGSYVTNSDLHIKKLIKLIKNIKNGSKIVKNENFQKNIFFCSFYVTLSLHAKNFDCTSAGVSCGQYKDKEEKTLKKTKKRP